MKVITIEFINEAVLSEGAKTMINEILTPHTISFDVEDEEERDMLILELAETNDYLERI